MNFYIRRLHISGRLVKKIWKGAEGRALSRLFLCNYLTMHIHLLTKYSIY